MMPKKMRTMRMINENYYRNDDGDFVRKFSGDDFWTVCIGDVIKLTATKEVGFKVFAQIVEGK